MQSHRISHHHVYTVDESPQFPVCHHGHSASIDMHSPLHSPWLIELPPSHFLSTCQAGGGAGGGHRREVSVSLEPLTDIPCLGQITEVASFQEPEPAVLTPYPMPKGGTAGLSAHSSKKCG